MDCKFYAGRGGVEFAVRVKEAGSGVRDHETRGPKVEHRASGATGVGIDDEEGFQAEIFFDRRGGECHG